jgi:predicted ArsR family transcriptional regulator
MDRLESREESTRKAILKFLKRHGEADAKKIAEFCGLTTMAIGRHLLKLSSDGLIQTRWERRPRGRPATLYSLTEQGDAQFPRDYAALAIEVLSSMVDEQVNQVFRKRHAATEVGYRQRTQGKNLGLQVRGLADMLTEGGYMAEVEPAGPNEFLVILCNCAIRDVAKRFPVACEEELCMIRNLVDGKVTRVTHLLAGDCNCSYRICPKARRQKSTGRRTSGRKERNT